MRDTLIVLLLVTVATLGYFVTNQKRQIKALEARPKTNTLELQEKCAKQAAFVFKESGLKQEATNGFINHYNDKLNKCMVILQATNVVEKEFAIRRTIYDAFEGTERGEFFGKFSEESTYRCEVTLPSGEKKPCRTLSEFEELAKVYME
jgi:hypothetical protein